MIGKRYAAWERHEVPRLSRSVETVQLLSCCEIVKRKLIASGDGNDMRLRECTQTRESCCSDGTTYSDDEHGDLLDVVTGKVLNDVFKAASHDCVADIQKRA